MGRKACLIDLPVSLPGGWVSLSIEYTDIPPCTGDPKIPSFDEHSPVVGDYSYTEARAVTTREEGSCPGNAP